MTFTITHTAHTDRIYSETVEADYSFKIGDMVLFSLNGLQFRVENKKILKWMQDSGNYFKRLK